MPRRLKAVFRFRVVGGEPEEALPALKLLLRTLRILRINDPQASLNVTPDEPEPRFDADGD